MEELDKITIEKYFAQELSVAEKNKVELQVQNDPEFRNEFNAYQLALEAIKIAQREELKNRFKQRDIILDKKSKGHSGQTYNLWMIGAIAATLLLLIWFFFNRGSIPQQEPVITSKDTIQVAPIPPIDTTDRASRETMASKETRKKEKPVIKEDEGEELFAAHFEPYTDESMDPVSRGDEDEMTALEKFQLHYWEKEYAKAVNDFSGFSLTQQQNDNLRFFLSNALMATGRSDEASDILVEVSRNDKSLYHKEALYYLALSQLNSGKIEDARRNLKTYIAYSNTAHYDKAVSILNRLD